MNNGDQKVPFPETKLSEELAQYDYGTFSIESFISWLESKLLGRRISLLTIDEGASRIDGGWVSVIERGCTHEWIVLSDHLQGIQKIHTFLHEIAHMINEHTTLVLNEDEIKEFKPEAYYQFQISFRSTNEELYNFQEAQAEDVARWISGMIALEAKLTNTPVLKNYLRSMRLD